MRIKQIQLPFTKRGAVCTFLATSCWHCGAKTVHEEGVFNFINRAKRHPWVHHGDIVEGITSHDKRYSHKEHTTPLLESMKWASGAIKRAKDTCAGLVLGNHDYSPSKEIGDVVEHIAGNAGVPYLTATCFAELVAENGQCTAFWAHGTGTAMYRTGEPERKSTNRAIKVRDILKPFYADICGMGHLHTSVVTPPCYEEKLSLQDGEVKRRPVLVRDGWYYAAPSMFLTYDDGAETANYAEMKIYAAKDLGWIEFDIQRNGEIACIREVYETGETKNEHYATVIS